MWHHLTIFGELSGIHTSHNFKIWRVRPIIVILVLFELNIMSDAKKTAAMQRESAKREKKSANIDSLTKARTTKKAKKEPADEQVSYLKFL